MPDTTPRDEATALLAEHEPTIEGDMDLGLASLTCSCGWDSSETEDASWWDHVALASPTLAADLEFAIAWRRVERALPGGHAMEAGSGMSGWWANAVDADYGGLITHAEGDTPTAALTRLAEALEGVSK